MDIGMRDESNGGSMDAPLWHEALIHSLGQ